MQLSTPNNNNKMHPHMHTLTLTLTCIHLSTIVFNFCSAVSMNLFVLLFRLFIFNTIALSAVCSACHLFAFFAVSMFGHHPLSPTICDVFLTRFHFFVYVFRTFLLAVVFMKYNHNVSAQLKQYFINYLHLFSTYFAIY